MESLKASYDVTPGLAVVLVGSRRDSATYVRMKKKACAEVGIYSIGIDLPIEVTQNELLSTVSTYLYSQIPLNTFNISRYRLII